MTRSMMCRLSLLLLGLLTTALPACSGREEPAPAEIVSAVAVSGGGVTVDVVTTNTWNTGFNGAVRITDGTFPSPITSFEVVFRLGGSIALTNVWNGNIAGP